MNFRVSAVLFGSAFSAIALLTLIDAAVKGFALFAAAALVALALRRASAAARHIVWFSALSCALVLPCCALLLPQWRVLPAWMSWQEVPGRRAAPAVAVALPSDPSHPAPAPLEPLPAPSLPPYEAVEPSVRKASSGIQLSAETLLLAWLGGALLLLVPLLYSSVALWRISARAQTANDGPLATALDQLQRELGRPRKVRLLLGSPDTMPMVWGVLRPRLLLPSTATAWTASRLRGVLLHELAHLRRHDPLSILIAQLALAIHWFNPLAWFAVRQLRAEQERACDDYVLRQGVRASDYASDLIAVATDLRAVRFADSALTMAHPGRLEGRVTSILDAARNRRAVTRWIAVAAALVAAAVALPLAMLRAADEKEAAPIIHQPATGVENPPGSLGSISVTLTPDAAEVRVDERMGSLAFLVGEGAEERVVVHDYGRSMNPIRFRVDADDRRGKWWNQVQLVRDGDSLWSFPELPDEWLPSGRVVFRPATEIKADGSIVIADIESSSGKKPLAVRLASPMESEKGAMRRIPRTCPDTEIIVSMQLHALAKNAPEKAVRLPVMAAQDLTGLPRDALAYPYLTTQPGVQAVSDRLIGWAERVEVTSRLAQGGIQVDGTVIIPFLEGSYATAAEAWQKREAAAKQGQQAPAKLRRLRAVFSGKLGGNDALVVPIASEGLFPETVVVALTALPRQLTRTRWLPEDSRSPIKVDGWVLTWPRAEHGWFAKHFDYKGVPSMITRLLERRKSPPKNSVTSESIGILNQDEVEALLQAFRTAPDVSVDRVEPFEVQQHNSRFSGAKDRTSFSASGERASLLMAVDGKTISPNLIWDDPVLERASAPSGYALSSGTSLCALLPGPPDPENIRMLILRCVDPDAKPVQPANAEVSSTSQPQQPAPATAEKQELPADVSSPAMPAKVRGRILDLNGFVLAESTETNPRSYPFKALASHVLGYTGDDHNSGHRAGKTGVEWTYDKSLHAGEDVHLSLDTRLQSATERTLRESDIGRGAVVILDATNGEVRALASTPNFDNNSFIPAVSSKKWSALSDNQASPLLNRALHGHAPSSTYHLVVAVAAARVGKANRTYTCRGQVSYGNIAMKCSISAADPGAGGHGKLNLRDALKHSCSCYFYQLGNEVGIEHLEKTARDLGLGERSGLGLPGESAGIVPSPEWLKKVSPAERWSDGYTANVAIGQGSTSATPVQMATIAAAIANGGRVMAPNLRAGAAPQLRHDLRLSGCPPEDLAMLRESMADCVESGMARPAKSEVISIAGRTGSAQYWREQGNGRVTDVAAWFIGYAPADAPRYSFAILVEGGPSGAVTAAPIARRIMEAVAAGLSAPEPQPESDGHFTIVPPSDN